ncbi:hypothetical protein K491DRAFT_433958 [Lophiostoma macrostomum CBS 122681]|uniref:Uncharacterized protein n=1 Tax=Lophiostoma macrostomum CBS 122681 TaxID=1314788 RepID=A0A6A6T8I1_9PLEO|nr:hypothetical protein K491DRAFT_433958 [Lophiostoma macrostomum CBS 122681]
MVCREPTNPALLITAHLNHLTARTHACTQDGATYSWGTGRTERLLKTRRRPQSYCPLLKPSALAVFDHYHQATYSTTITRRSLKNVGPLRSLPHVAVTSMARIDHPCHPYSRALLCSQYVR